MIHINFLSALRLSILLTSTESLENNGMLKKVEFHPFLAQNGMFRVPFSFSFFFCTRREKNKNKTKKTNKQTNYTSIHYHVLYFDHLTDFSFITVKIL